MTSTIATTRTNTTKAAAVTTPSVFQQGGDDATVALLRGLRAVHAAVKALKYEDRFYTGIGIEEIAGSLANSRDARMTGARVHPGQMTEVIPTSEVVGIAVQVIEDFGKFAKVAKG